MPIQARTRKQLRQSIGYRLGALETGTAYDAGSTTTLVSLSLVGGDDNYNGKRITVFDTSNSDSPETRIIKDFEASAYRLTWQEAISFATVASPSPDTYEIWDEPYRPEMIHDFINQAIMEATGLVYDRIEIPDMSTSASRASHSAIHTDGSSMRFVMPSNVSMLNNIYYRSSVSFTELHSCKTDFDEQSTLVGTNLDGAITSLTATSFDVDSASTLRANQQIKIGAEYMTISSISSNTLTVVRGISSAGASSHLDNASVLVFPMADTEDKKRGTASNKLIISSSAGAGQLVSDSISSKDISKYDYLECWIKSTVSTSAGNLKILLDDTASCASPLEELSVPALTEDAWTFVRLKLANPELDTAIISVGLEYDSDIGACTVWLDDIKVVQNDTAVWEKLPKHLWTIDKESRDLVFKESGKFETNYSLLKLSGGDKPVLLTSDTDTTEIDDSYIISRATSLALLAASGGPATDPDALRQQASFEFGLSEQAKRRFPTLVNARTVS
tara:strand:- start:2678 stop:4189 length:1512 start_codon:yes stop_codon:yes gene_type:complete